MRRRQFVQRSLAAAATMTGIGGWASARAATKDARQEFYELRTYQIPNATMQKVVSEYLANGLVPALGRQGITRIGVFTQLPQEDKKIDHSIIVLIPYLSLDAFAAQRALLAADADYRKAAADYYAQPMKDPAYTRINSRLMRAFAGMPVIELPRQTSAHEPRILELRTYQSHNEDAATRKVDMFNSGEIQLMRDVKLAPVFYGEMLIGDNVPNLTYMLSAGDMESHQAHWKAFIDHPEWKRMKAIEKYKGTVSHIDKWYLKPTEYSGI